MSELTRRQILEELRVKLRAALADASPREVAAVSKELREVIRELDTMPRTEGSALDELASRRADSRKSAAAGP